MHANLAVWTTYLVLAQYGFTRFQKGLERVVGRGLGILAGLVLTTWFHDTPVLTLVLIAVLLTSFFYFYFAGRLAYTFLQAGLYLVAMFQIGHANPGSAVPAAEGLFAAIVLGVVVAVRGELAGRRRARPRHSFRGDPTLAGARRVAEPEPDARRHRAADLARGPCARPAAGEDR